MLLSHFSAPILLLVGWAMIAAPTRSIAQDENTKELEKLRGEWELRSSERNGKDNTPAKPETMSINGSEYSFVLPGGTTQKVKFRIDTTTQPKHFDRISPTGDAMPGIYKLDGDILTICRGQADTRPTEFKTTETGGALTVWKRKK